MAKIRNDEMEKYEEGSNPERKEFFNLKDDGDKAYVRFMHEGMEDITRVVCHTIEVDGKYRKINCLRNYDEPLDKCPLCSDKKPASVRIFLELRVYEFENGKFNGKYTTQIWERGRDFNKKLQSLCNRLRDGKALCDVVYEIERVGKKGDQRTTYEIYECPEITTSEAPFDGELPEQYDPVGSIVLDKTKEEVETFLVKGTFPTQDDKLERRETPNQYVEETQQTSYSQQEQPRPRRRI